MKIPGKRSREDQLTRELREQQAVVERAVRTPAGSPRDVREQALKDATVAAARAGEIRRELEQRDTSRQRAATAQATGSGPNLPTSSPAQRSEWQRMLDEQAERRAEQKRQMELDGAEAARKRHAERERQGLSLRPLWNPERPCLEALAILGSGRIDAWLRGVAVVGEDLRTWDGTIVEWDEIAAAGGRVPPLIDAAEVACLLNVCHLLAASGPAGVVQVHPRQPRLWTAGLTDIRGSLRRLGELGLLDVHESNADTLRLAWGPVAIAWIDEFVGSFTPPKRRGRRPKITSPDVQPEPSVADEAEVAISELRARLAAEQQPEPERPPTFASSLPPSGAADRERARARREAGELQNEAGDGTAE